MSKNQENVRTESEINEVLDKVFESEESGSIYPGMSYEDGVKAAIEWILNDDAPEVFD